ncbi:DUF1906 domain-containing protein [Clostridium botulinum]|nr:DUF1906 domain-containing protein [Clostridium botulinum]
MDQMVLETQKWLNKTYKGRISSLTEDGVTGWGTIRALTKALQLELGVGADGLWGPGTESRCPTISSNGGNRNIITILQCGLFCKGYDGGGIDGNYTSRTSSGISKLKRDAGLSDTSGSATPLIFKALLSTMDGFVLASTGDTNVRKIQQNLNRDYYKVIGLIACNGVYSRDTNRALIKALQLEIGVGADGIWGPGTQSKCPTIPGSGSNKRFVLLLQYSLYVNGVDPHGFDGLFGNGLSNAIKEFQSFCALPADGYAGKQVWASLLVSTGDKNRKGTACDCAQTITAPRAASLKANGYKIVGRYLTGKFKMTPEEIQTIFANGLRLFPIFEVGGYQNSYFTSSQGTEDAMSAMETAMNLGFGKGTIIYFAVDYDAYGSNIPNNVMPYFSAIKNQFNANNPQNYRIGIYAPRRICTLVAEKGYSCSSFVCDMSSGFSGNLGYPLPKDWAFDQISTVTVGSGSGSIEIDNNICSNKDTGVSSVSNITTEKTEAIVVTGSEYEKFYQDIPVIGDHLPGRFKYNFIEPSIKQLLEYKSNYSNNTTITWLISSIGYSETDIRNFRNTAKKINVNIVFFRSDIEFINYLNAGLKNSSGKRVLISKITIFSHGLVGKLALGYKQEDEDSIDISENEILKINKNVFSSDIYTVFFSCNAGTSDKFNSLSFAQNWVYITGGKAKAAVGKTDYKYTVGNWDKNKNIIKERRKATGYMESGSLAYPGLGDGAVWKEFTSRIIA